MVGLNLGPDKVKHSPDNLTACRELVSAKARYKAQ